MELWVLCRVRGSQELRAPGEDRHGGAFGEVPRAPQHERVVQGCALVRREYGIHVPLFEEGAQFFGDERVLVRDRIGARGGPRLLQARAFDAVELGAAAGNLLPKGMQDANFVSGRVQRARGRQHFAGCAVLGVFREGPSNEQQLHRASPPRMGIVSCPCNPSASQPGFTPAGRIPVCLTSAPPG